MVMQDIATVGKLMKGIQDHLILLTLHETTIILKLKVLKNEVK